MKKILSIAFVLVLVALLLPAVALADTGDTLEITLTDQFVDADGWVEIPINITANPGIAYLSLKVKYDEAVFSTQAEPEKTVTVTNGQVFSGMTSGTSYVWKDDAGEDVATTGLLGTIKMGVVSGAMQPGAEYEVSIEVVECWNGDEEAVTVTTTSAKVKIPVAEHTCSWTIKEKAVATTCETAGKTAVEECSICHATKGGDEIPALNHKMEETEKSVAATCETAGKTAVLTCANGCGKTEGGEEIPALGHDWKDVEAVDATCEKAGHKAGRECSVCHATEGCEEIPALSHKMVETEKAVAATCETAGKTAVLTCANGCGKTEGGEEIPALTHKWVEDPDSTENKAATCTEAGVKAYKCANDGCTETKTETIDALGHGEWKDDYEVTKEATCGEDGVAKATCGRCGELIEDIVVPATGKHTWDEGKVTKEATTTAEGEKTYTCEVCGATKTEAIAKLTASGTAKKDDVAKTGDESHVWLWAALALTACAAGAVVVATRKKEN